MKWQPIETAPTDGTRILLRGRNGKIADGHYGQPDGFANPKRFVWPYINATPTHWAPLALIAAAPELLDAAMKVNALSIQTDAHKELRAAIANATGHVFRRAGAFGRSIVITGCVGDGGTQFLVHIGLRSR